MWKIHRTLLTSVKFFFVFFYYYFILVISASLSPRAGKVGLLFIYLFWGGGGGGRHENGVKLPIAPSGFGWRLTVRRHDPSSAEVKDLDC